jgi:hypothetical protein
MSITKQQVWHLAYTCVGRRSDYALQQPDGRYLRVGQPLTYEALRLHLSGSLTIGTYLIDEQGWCHFAVFDADSVDGLLLLLSIQRELAADGISSYLELSRRGGHLRVFLSRLTPAATLRRWLLPYCPPGVEFYPKRDWANDVQPGSLIRLPFGVHRLSDRRYPFVQQVGGELVPVASTVAESLTWLSTVQRATVPDEPWFTESNQVTDKTNTPYSTKKEGMTTFPESKMTVRDWCLAQNPLSVIGRYVDLDANGLGCCPFGAHHSDGKDSHPSLWVHVPKFPNVACWYCHTWRSGGSLFEFLSLYHGLSKKELWHRILGGEQF